METGENIRYLRKQAHLSQKGLAELAGLNVSVIRGYESGKFKPKMENLSKLCTVLNCSVDDIMGESNLSSNEENIEQNTDSQYMKIVDKLKKGKPLYSPELYFLCTNYVQKYYQDLNEEGMKQAGKIILDFLERLNGLSHITDFRNED